MKELSEPAQKVFAAAIVKLGKRQHLRIGNAQGSYMPLVVEAIGFTKFVGNETTFRVYSFAHYGQQNGDAMRDPDVVMLRCPATGTLYPISFRNDYVGIENDALVYNDDGGITGVHEKMQTDIATFCTMWASNLHHQQGLGK